MQDSIECFAQVQAGDISHFYFIHHRCNSSVKGHQIGQAQFTLSEAMLAVSNHRLVFHVPWHSFLEDLLHDLARHLGESSWPVFPGFSFFPFLKVGILCPLFQSLGTSLACLNCSDRMENGLATSSVSFLRICGCISSGSMDLCTFRFQRWS